MNVAGNHKKAEKLSNKLELTDSLLLCLMQQLRLNLLNPTGHVMHQKFNIQQLYALPTLYLCVLYLSKNE